MEPESTDIALAKQLIVSTLDDATLADARPELERIRLERRSLEEQIAAEEAAAHARALNPEEVADRIALQVSELSARLKTTRRRGS